MIDYDAHSWWRIVLTMRGSVGPRLVVRVAISLGLGFLALWAYRNAGVAVPPLAHTLIGVALGLLLVFRTNASYARYVDARVLLGRISDGSRDLARQVAAYVSPGSDTEALHRDLARWLDAFFALLVQSLRAEDRLEALGDKLVASEVAKLAPVKARSLVVGAWISSRLADLYARGRIDVEILRAMDANLTAMGQAFGSCHRIRETPVPFAYAQHIKVFLVLFCYTVPFVMAETLGLYTPIASAVLAFALFGIDEIGVEIEDPFGTDPNDLPMDRLADAISSSVAELLAAGRDPSTRVVAAE